MGNMLPLILVIVAALLALALVVLALRRISKEGITVSSASKPKHFVRSVEDVKRRHEQAQVDSSITEDQSQAGEIIFTRHGFGKIVQSPAGNAAARVEAGLKQAGLQVVEKVDVNKLLDRSDAQPYYTLAFYHKKLAATAILDDPSVGLIQFSAVIRQDFADAVHVEFADPVKVVEQARVPSATQMALDVKSALTRILNSF